MGRWEPGAEQRLQAAAMTLFQQRGYDNVTVAEIAQRAGLTRRTFFNHFAEKREIFFSGAEAFRESVVEHLDRAPAGLGPLDAAAAALTEAGAGIGRYREHTLAVHAVVLASAELMERDRAKTASVADAIATGLERRGAAQRVARIASSTAMIAYQEAWLAWGEQPGAEFAELMRRSVADLRAVVRQREKHG